MFETPGSGIWTTIIGCIAAFVITFWVIKLVGGKLPRDHGREFAVAGELSQGKIRGAGILMMPVFAVVAIVCTGFSLRIIVYCVLMLLSMLSGYLDDASDVPWSELKKGIVDFVICLLIGVSIVVFEPELCVLDFGSAEVHVNKVLYVILAAAFLWLMINAVNCADGIDGLSSTLLINSFAAACIASAILGRSEKVSGLAFIMAAVLAGYLIFNHEPSTVLMGDAGSRPLGLFLGLLFLRMGNALLAVPFCIVILIDGLLGLLKLAVLRTVKVQSFMANIRTPLHDHFRKNKGKSNSWVRRYFNLAQIAVSVVFLVLLLIIK